VDDSDSFAG
jgi:hypothetical protein